MSSFINLHEESLYLQGARDVLMKLKDNYEMYLIPSIKCKCKSKFLNTEETYSWFPLNNAKSRRMVGEAVLDALIKDREQLAKLIYEDYDHISVESVQKDRKGKVSSITIRFE